MGQWFYLHLILDVFSRKVVAWEVHATDDADHAVRVVKRAALAERIAGNANKPVLHGDNGATLKATTVLAMLNWLGIKPSYSRPRVSDDNADAEALFKTAKYRPEYPKRGSGPPLLWTGTTMNIVTAVSTTSRRQSDTMVGIAAFLRRGKRFIPKPRPAAQAAGTAVPPETGTVMSKSR